MRGTPAPLLLVALACALLLPAAYAQTVIDVYDTTAPDPDDWVLIGQVQPIVTAETGQQHYDYFNSSGHPAGVALAPLRANTWMHEDANTGDLTFGFIFGMEDDGIDNATALFFRVVGSATDPYVSQSDDPGEATETPPGSDIFVGDYDYNPCCSDGIALSGISGGEWTVIIDAVDFGVITEWLLADGADGAPDLPLTLGNEYRLTPEGNDPSDLPVDDLCDGIAVTTTDDSGTGSLRQAILDANATAAADTICFVIPGEGVHTIAPTSALPAVEHPVLIDGYTQPGSSPNTLPVGSDAELRIEVDGSAAGVSSPGLRLTGTGITVRGLAIGDFNGDLVRIEGGGENVVEGCFLGTDASGTQAREGNSGFWIVDSDANTLGGTTPASRNVVAGDLGGGFFVFPGSDDNRILNTYIGTDPSGATSVGENGGGVFILGADDTVIGAPGAGNVIAGIDGGRLFVLVEDDDAAERTVIQGNYIGTNAAGDAALGESGGGVFISGAPNTRLGGPGEGEGNLISAGDEEGGVFINDDGPFASAGTAVQGNLIGTDASGTIALNQCCGIDVSSPHVLIGGTAPGARNVISGNTSDGISIDDSVTVQGNYIGVDATGAAPLGNGSGGIWVSGDGNQIGGTEPGAGNVIAATGPDDGGAGIIVRSGAAGNVIEGNLIGTDPAGTKAWGNGLGIRIQNAGTSDNRVGGTEEGAANVIVYNTLGGVGLASDAGTGNAILGNRMRANGGPGIDLLQDGPTDNDADDADGGPNRLQNTPTLLDAGVSGAGDLVVTYRVDTAPAHATYPLRVELFRADADAEEGAAFLGADAYSEADHDAGDGTKTVNLGSAAALDLAEGDPLVATATDAAGNTSEFSAVAAVVVSAAAEAGGLPEAFALAGPYPNPVTAYATVGFDLPEPARVRLSIYDVLGREVAVLVDEERPPGRHEVVLDRASLPSGIYFCRMEAAAFTSAEKLLILR